MLNGEPLSEQSRKTVRLILIYFLLACLALMNHSGGGDILFAGAFVFALSVHLIILLIVTIVRAVKGQPTWRRSLSSMGLLVSIFIAFWGLTALQGESHRDLLTPFEREEMERQQKESSRISDSLSKDTSMRIGIRDDNLKVGFTDKQGKIRIPIIYDDADAFWLDTVVRAKLHGKWGFINRQGKMMAPFIYDDAGPFDGQFAAVAKANLWGYINNQGKEVIEFKYSKADAFSNGLAAVSKDTLWGYINSQGKEVIDFKYDRAGPFSDGLAAVSGQGKWGYIDSSGKLRIPFMFDEVYDFHDNTALVRHKGKKFRINKRGFTVSK